ncbi:MAG: tetratricopeptide repeat protein, partial [Deltaproteobacteria bacterium]|nr:tetratricopeptide repeat protein [Deltaproteobacteria bacterium]
MKNRQKVINSLLILGLILTVLLIYSSNLDGPFILDDFRIQTNPQIQIDNLTLQNLVKAGFESSPGTRPIAHISFALNYFFHGFDTRGYHLVNIAIHALTAIFLYLFIQTTLNLPLLKPKYDGFYLLPFAAALLWAVHPLQTQSVTYIIQRMNSMAGMFYILSFYFYIKGRITEKTWQNGVLFLSSLTSGLLALGSKEIAATLPFFIFLYEWYFLQDLDSNWLKKQIVPVFILLLTVALLVMLYLGENPIGYILNSYSKREFTLTQRLLTESRVIIFYVSLLLFPHPGRLNLDHDFVLSTGIGTPFTTLLSALFLLIILIVSVGSAKKHRLFSFCILWFLGNLVIESSVIGLEIIFEHRNYLPSMMLVLLGLVLIYSILKHPYPKLIALCLIVLLCSYWTFERNKMWNDKVVFWGDCVGKSPQKARPHNNLGVALAAQDRTDEAIKHYKKTIEIDPQFGKAFNNLGNAYQKSGKYEEARALYEKALEIIPDNPKIHVNMGIALAKLGQLEEALI